MPRQGEEAAALVIDNCVCKDDYPKCDGLFLLKGNNRYWIILVELKGGEIERAFKQLAFVKHSRPEYNEIAEVFADNQPLHIIHSAFVISNHMISKQVHQRLENTFQVRVRKILFSEATKPIPDLRKHL